MGIIDPVLTVARRLLRVCFRDLATASCAGLLRSAQRQSIIWRLHASVLGRNQAVASVAAINYARF